MTPITVFVRFFFSVASLAEQPASPEEEAAVDVEALLEAGEEEGILEESDSDLVRSAVEFGDKLVREVMTPRPEVFAVPETMTLEQFLELLKEHNFSRVPVYAGTLDNVTGIAFAHDLLQITDEEARTRTVASIEHPAVFVPETKRGYELLREMQREKQHMRIVIDEYGGVAGLVTIEDLLEEIVGNIQDEHEAEIADGRAAAGAGWLVAGAGEFSRGPACGSVWRADRAWARSTRRRRWAGWSARSRGGFRWRARWCCWSRWGCAWRWWLRRTGGWSGCGCFRWLGQQTRATLRWGETPS